MVILSNNSCLSLGNLFDFTFFSCSWLYGFVSSITLPSKSLIILVEYFSANSALWVTIIISLSLLISFNIFITCSLVSESSAPVGSSASKISGLLTSDLAIATRCICPPLSWFGFLFTWSFKPTVVNASTARLCRSSLLIPASESANSTFSATVRCIIKL